MPSFAAGSALFCIPVVLTGPSLLLHGIAFRCREFFSSACRRSLLLIAVRPQNFTIRCVLLYFSRTPALPFPMVAPVPAQIPKLGPRLPASRRRSLPLSLLSTHYPLCSSAQLLCFLSHPCKPSSFMQLRTLLRNGAPLSLLFSIASALFLSSRGCTRLCGNSKCSAVPLGRHLCFQLIEMHAWRITTETRVATQTRVPSISPDNRLSDAPSASRMPLRDLPICQVFCLHRLAASLLSLCLFFEPPPFVFNRFRPLSTKHPGGGPSSLLLATRHSSLATSRGIKR